MFIVLSEKSKRLISQLDRVGRVLVWSSPLVYTDLAHSGMERSDLEFY